MRRGFLSVINTPLRNARGEISWIIHRVHDVSESQHALQRLGRAEASRRNMADRHALALAASGMGAWEYDRAHGELTWDAQARALIGFAGDAPISFTDFFARIHPEDQPRVRERVDAILSPEGSDELSISYRIIDAGGAISGWLEARGRATYEDGVCVRVAGVLINVTARQRYESHLRLLINELNHRVKNTLAVVQSIATQTLRADAPTGEAREQFIERLMALAAAHDILTRENWEGADLAAVVDRALAVHASGDEQRVLMEGPPLRVSPRVSLSLAMALHELATNAVKYGALSAPSGKVEVRWTLEEADAELRLVWRETGGPKPAAPKRKGFGMRLLERVLAQDIGGTVAVEFTEVGLVCTVTAPSEAWRAATTPLTPPDAV
jgi:two-component sensor histidine kinase